MIIYINIIGKENIYIIHYANRDLSGFPLGFMIEATIEKTRISRFKLSSNNWSRLQQWYSWWWGYTK